MIVDHRYTVGMYTTESDYLKLTTQKLQAVALVAADKNDVEVAQIVGVSRETVNRWRHHNPAFKKAVSAHRKQLAVDIYIEQSDDLSELIHVFKKYLPKKYYRIAMKLLECHVDKVRTITNNY